MYATVNGLSIYYESVGRSIPCLVPSLAGTPIYERTFSSPAVLAHLQFVFAELRANRTPVGDLEAITVETVVADMNGLRQVLGFEQMAVLGHSGHSTRAFAYAARYPAAHLARHQRRWCAGLALLRRVARTPRAILGPRRLGGAEAPARQEPGGLH